MLKRKKVEDFKLEDTRILTKEIVEDILKREDLGIPIKKTEKLWFDNQEGVRKAGLKYAMSDYELEEYVKCKQSVQYFSEKYCQIKREDGSIGPMKLRNYQKKIIDLYTNNRFSILAASRQTGKDQPLDSVVFDINGKKRFGDLKIGDQIYGDNGELTNVIGIYPQGIKDVYEIEFSDGVKVRCGENHLWNVIKYKKEKTIELSEIKKNYLTKRGDSIYYVKMAEPVNYSTKELIIDPYLLGIIIGDGCTKNNRLEIATMDEEIINYLHTLEDDDIFIEKIYRKDKKNQCQYAIRKTNNKPHKIIKKLKLLNIHDKYSYEKFIPEIYKYSDINQRLELLRGLLDTDGCCSDNLVTYCTTSELLSNDFRDLCHSLGIRTGIRKKIPTYTYKGIKKKGRLAYEISLYLRNNYKYDIFKIKRKQNNIKNKKFDWGTKRGITNITYIGKEETQCIEVDNETHLYLTDNYIPTHNTVSASIVLLHFCLFNDDKNVMIVANKGKTVVEIVDKIKSIYTLLPFFIKQGVLNWNQKQITFENNCKIKTENRSKSPSIGFTIDFLYLDEFAHIPNNIIVPYYTAVVPTVSSIKNSKIVITSTPKGYNLFHQLLTDAERPLGDPQKGKYKALRVYWWEMEGKRDTKLIFNEVKLNKYLLNMPQLTKKYILDNLKNDYNYCVYETIEDGEKIYNVKFDINLENTTISYLRNIKIDNIPLTELMLISNWEEEQTKLIGGPDAFKQEFDLQFITSNSLLFDNIIMEKITSSEEEFDYINIEKFNNKSNLSYSELQFLQNKPDIFDISKAKEYNIITSIDLSEGIGGDHSVINIFRLMLKDQDTINRYKDNYTSIYDYFKLEQIGVYRYNSYAIREIAHILYMIIFDLFDADKCKVVLEHNMFGGDLLNCMPHVFNDNNDYSNAIFTRFKHNQEKTIAKPGLKINRNKNVLIKDFQDNLKKGNVVIHNKQNILEINMFSRFETPSGEVSFKAETGNDDIVMTCITLSSIFSHTDYKNMIDDYVSKNLRGDFFDSISKRDSSNVDDTNLNFDNFTKGYRSIYKTDGGPINVGLDQILKQNKLFGNKNPFQRNPWG